MYHVSVLGVDERMINVHYYYYVPLRASQSFYLSGRLGGKRHVE